jgi:hypothetical protein
MTARSKTKIIGISGLVASAPLLWAFYSWAKTEFTPRYEYTQLQQIVASHDLELTYQALLRQYEFLQKLHQKNPGDAEIKRKLKDTERRLREIEKQLQNRVLG